jgi:hypothetical protein
VRVSAPRDFTSLACNLSDSFMRANTSSEVCIQEICHLRNSSIETLSPRVVHQIISRFDISSVRSGIEPLRTLENVETKNTADASRQNPHDLFCRPSPASRCSYSALIECRTYSDTWFARYVSLRREALATNPAEILCEIPRPPYRSFMTLTITRSAQRFSAKILK